MSLINDILDFSKLCTGKAQVKKECFSFKEIIQELNSTVGSRLKEKKQKIHYVLDENLPEYIISDKLKLLQILINLVSNANKFSFFLSLSFKLFFIFIILQLLNLKF